MLRGSRPEVSLKKMFLKISQKSHRKTIVLESLFSESFQISYKYYHISPFLKIGIHCTHWQGGGNRRTNYVLIGMNKVL